MEQKLTDEDRRLLTLVQDKLLSGIRLGFDISELNILDDVNASRRQIQELGSKLAVNNTELSVTILEVAHSIYFGHSLKGDVPDFFDAVIRMGADRVKMLIFSLTLFSLEKGPAARMRAARSASISVLGRMIAESMGLRDDMVRKIETGGLLSQMGRNILLKSRELGLPIDDAFIERCEKPLADALIDRLGLDPFLRQVIDAQAVDFDAQSFSLIGIIQLAQSLADDSFRKHGKLVIRSPLPDSNGVLTRTPGSDIQKLFAVLDVSEFLQVIEAPTERQLEAKTRKKGAGPAKR